MQVNGVSPGGKELELFPGLSLQVPFGAVYARNEDGNWDLSMPRSAPRGYRDGPFELDDEAETAWKLSDFRQVFSGTIEAPPGPGRQGGGGESAGAGAKAHRGPGPERERRGPLYLRCG